MINVTLYKVTYEDNYVWGNDEEGYDKKVAPFIAAGIEVYPFDAERSSQPFIDNEPFLVDEKRIAFLTISGIKINVEATVTTQVDISEQLSNLAEKQFTIKQDTQEFNNKCDVHIAGHALSTYNEVMLIEDACTDVLQENINKGWRILAVCPQPDQRRPDYMLGRWNYDLTPVDYAVRG